MRSFRKALAFIPTVLMMLIGSSPARCQELEWVRSVGGDYSDVSYSIALDQYGNSYTTGFFSTTVDFFPGVGEHVISNMGGYFDCFVSKLNTNGEFVWAKAFQGYGDAEGIDLAVDSRSNVYVVGQIFFDKIDFDPGADTFYLDPGESEFSGFLVKLDSVGDLAWAIQLGPGWYARSQSVDVDDDGNVYVTGHFSDSIDLDPGPGIHMLTAPGDYQDLYVVKYDGDGRFIWGKHLLGTDDEAEPRIDVSASGHVHVSGNFTETLEVNPGGESVAFTSNGGYDFFVAKYDTAGVLIWARQIGGEQENYAHSLTTDRDGHVYVGGMFSGMVDFDPGPDTYMLTAEGAFDLFLLKLDMDGELVWCRQMSGGDGLKFGHSLAVDTAGKVYMAGFFEDPVDFDPGESSFILIPEENLRTFLVVFGPGGDFERAFIMPGDVDHFDGNRLAIDHENRLFQTGVLQGTADFDPGPAYYPITGAWYEFYVVKLALMEKPSGVSSMEDAQLVIHPNPSSDGFHVALQSGTLESVSLTDAMGRSMLEMQVEGVSVHLSTSGMAPGMYIIRVVTDRGLLSQRVLLW